MDGVARVSFAGLPLLPFLPLLLSLALPLPPLDGANWPPAGEPAFPAPARMRRSVYERRAAPRTVLLAEDDHQVRRVTARV